MSSWLHYKNEVTALTFLLKQFEVSISPVIDVQTVPPVIVVVIYLINGFSRT